MINKPFTHKNAKQATSNAVLQFLSNFSFFYSEHLEMPKSADNWASVYCTVTTLQLQANIIYEQMNLQMFN